jgi:hypothetical protein
MKTNMLVMFFGMMKMVLTMVIDKILILVIKRINLLQHRRIYLEKIKYRDFGEKTEIIIYHNGKELINGKITNGNFTGSFSPNRPDLYYYNPFYENDESIPPPVSVTAPAISYNDTKKFLIKFIKKLSIGKMGKLQKKQSTKIIHKNLLNIGILLEKKLKKVRKRKKLILNFTPKMVLQFNQNLRQKLQFMKMII